VAPANESSAERPGLSRDLRLSDASIIVVANMIGAGIFTTSGLLLRELGSPILMLVLWVAGGFLALCGAFCYGELGAAMPRAGGEYAYLSELYHPLLGFLTGWVSLVVGFSAPLAATAIGFSEYIARAFPALLELGGVDVAVKGLAVAIIAILAAIHLRGVAYGARVQNWLTGGKVFLIVACIVVGFVFGSGDFGNLLQTTTGGADGIDWRAVGLSLMWIMFVYSGWNSSAYMGAEIRDPRRTLPRSLIIGTGAVIGIYLGINLLFVYAAPPDDSQGVIAIGGLAASRLFGTGAERFVSIVIGFALVSSVSALIMLGPRVYYAMARDGCFFGAIGEVDPESRVPAKSIMLQCLIAVIMVLTGTFEQILTFMGFCLGIFPIAAVLGVFKLRRRPDALRSIPAYPLPPLIFIATSVAILVLAYLERPMESSVALATVAAGIPLYYFFTRHHRSAGAPGKGDES
jgi:APA family basic amino acid/polyamine antiporter